MKQNPFEWSEVLGLATLLTGLPIPTCSRATGGQATTVYEPRAGAGPTPCAGVTPTDALRSLLLEAHAAAARRRRNRLPAALALYDRGRAEGWTWSLRSRRKLLGECARQGQLTPGLAILDEFEANGEVAPFGIVETLFSQSHRRGVVSDEAWREWRDEGPSLEDDEDQFRYKLD